MSAVGSPSTSEERDHQRPARHQGRGGHIHPVLVGQRERGAGLAGLRNPSLEARGALVRGYAMHDLQVLGRYPARLDAVALRRAADGVELVFERGHRSSFLSEAIGNWRDGIRQGPSPRVRPRSRAPHRASTTVPSDRPHAAHMPCQSFGSTGLAQKNSEALPRKLLCGLRLYLCVRPIFGYGLNPVLPAVWGDGVDFHSRSMTPATHGSNCPAANWVSSPSCEKLSEEVGRIARGLRRGIVRHTASALSSRSKVRNAQHIRSCSTFFWTSQGASPMRDKT